MTPIPPPPLLYRNRPALQAWRLSPEVRHLNHAACGAVPQIVFDRQARIREEMESIPATFIAHIPERVAQARDEVAPFFGVDPELMAFVPNVQAGVTCVLASLDLDERTEVVTTNHLYGAVRMAWERLAGRRGFRIVTVDVPLAADEQTSTELILDAVTPSTRVVSLDQVTSLTARGLPVARVVESLAGSGIRVLADGAHAAGAVESPVEGSDYWIGSLHKFAAGPHGTGVLVTSESYAQDLYPVINSWGMNEPFPSRFDNQGTADVSAYLAASTAIQFIESEWGWGTVRRYVISLLDYAETIVADAFSTLTGEDHRVARGMPADHVRLVRLPPGVGCDAQSAAQLKDRLTEALQVEVGITHHEGVGYLRLGAFVYNTAEDFEWLCDEVVPRLMPGALK